MIQRREEKRYRASITVPKELIPLAKLLYGERGVAKNIVSLIRKDAKEKVGMFVDNRDKYISIIEAMNELERKQLARKFRKQSVSRIIGVTVGGRPKGSKNKHGYNRSIV